jgi:hypothetical protein
MKKLITLLACLLIINICHAITTYPTLDGQITSKDVITTTLEETRVGKTWSAGYYNAEFAFTLPELPAGQQFAAVEFSVRSQMYGSTPYSGDLYGLNYRTTNSLSLSDYYTGALDPSTSSTLLQTSFLHPTQSSSSVRQVCTNTVTTADYFNTQYKASTTDRTAGETISVFFRLNSSTSVSGDEFYKIKMKEYNTSFYWPYIVYTTEDIPPEPPTGTLIIID